MKLLILCRYGVFGGRLVQLLGDLPQLEILVAGRNLSAAKAFCRDFEGEATLRPFELDRANAAKVFAGENLTLSSMPPVRFRTTAKRPIVWLKPR